MSGEQKVKKVCYPTLTLTYDPETKEAYAKRLEESYKKLRHEISDVRQKIVELEQTIAEMKETLGNNAGFARGNERKEEEEARRRSREAKEEMHKLLAFNMMNVFC